ncbi:methyltransferase family protein [Edaphobacter bradus]|uniref:methyltransferase family protein n=1 Tax=Edaphobacter bradus TaxID=2259016 RepID=UPI0021DF6E5B|nr:isoprenylcysteine carboxylmethyltransferase family protein [Edaphobacter bradus]
MANLILWNEANTLWMVFALYFAARYRPVQVKRDGGFHIFSLERMWLLLAALLIFFPRSHLSYLAAPLHVSRALAMAGFCLTVAGLAFSAWARDVLGSNWSGRVIIQDHHQLITAGPYAYVRHPLYTGLLIAMAGTVLISGALGAVLGFFSAIIFFNAKAGREERILESEFGSIYTNYRAHTGKLLPRIAHV